MSVKTVYLAADHGGFGLKKELIGFLQQAEWQAVDLGPFSLEPEDDYPDFAFLLGEKVAADKGSLGILLCRRGGGMAIAANKVKGVRAVVGLNEKEVAYGKETNGANILTLPADCINSNEAKKLVKLFLTTVYTKEERHLRRIEKIKKYEARYH